MSEEDVYKEMLESMKSPEGQALSVTIEDGIREASCEEIIMMIAEASDFAVFFENRCHNVSRVIAHGLNKILQLRGILE